MKKYYQLVKEGTSADLYIYGDIVEYAWDETDVTSFGLAQELEALEVDHINCYINSYGGSVAAGLSIYNQLKRHSAKVTTICDGFACSAASVIFMAGDERVMNSASLLMIHNAWCSIGAANADELRKQADDLEVITQASINAYMQSVNITESELKALMDAESWILPADALAMGFATSIVDEPESNQASQSVKSQMVAKLTFEPSLKEPFVQSVIPEEYLQKVIDDAFAKFLESAKQSEPEPPPEPDPIPDPVPENKLLKFLQTI